MFVLKSKGIIFTEPTLIVSVDKNFLNNWKEEQKKLSEWLDVFASAKSVRTIEEEVHDKDF